MKLIRYIVRLYLSRFPITEGKKYIYVFAIKYLLPSRSNILFCQPESKYSKRIESILYE